MLTRNNNGQAKILTESELNRVLAYFKYSRDKAIFGICFYTACRVSEARQMHRIDAFHGDEVLDAIMIRGENTKGKGRTRIIPTHQRLRGILQEYHQNAQELLKLRNIFGDWSPHNLNANGNLFLDSRIQCPCCLSSNWSKQGLDRRGRQIRQKYRCNNCKGYFQGSKAIDSPSSQIIEYNPLGVLCTSNSGFLGENPHNPFLFPGRQNQGCLSLRTALTIFETAFKDLGIEGASSHSCRRSALTMMHRENIVLRVLQEISGHKDLGALQRYLEVTPEQTQAAINLL